MRHLRSTHCRRRSTTSTRQATKNRPSGRHHPRVSDGGLSCGDGILGTHRWAANPAPEVGKRHGVDKKAANLFVRLDTQRTDVLRFATDFRAGWDNNQAERDVRMLKLQQKISGSWRTLGGARAYCTIRSLKGPTIRSLA